MAALIPSRSTVGPISGSRSLSSHHPLESVFAQAREHPHCEGLRSADRTCAMGWNSQCSILRYGQSKSLYSARGRCVWLNSAYQAVLGGVVFSVHSAEGKGNEGRV